MEQHTGNLLPRRKSLRLKSLDLTTKSDGDAIPNDKQRFKRCAVFLRATINVDNQPYDCEVLNISAGGALIRVSGTPEFDGEFTINMEGFPPLSAEVVRTHQNNHGIAFREDPKKVAEMVAELLASSPHAREQRRFPRRLVLLAASFYVGDRFVQAKVHNLSAGGAYIKADTLPDPGQTIDLNLARFGIMRVRVVWTDEGAMGVNFVDPTSEIIKRIGHLLPGLPDIN